MTHPLLTALATSPTPELCAVLGDWYEENSDPRAAEAMRLAGERGWRPYPFPSGRYCGWSTRVSWELVSESEYRHANLDPIIYQKTSRQGELWSVYTTALAAWLDFLAACRLVPDAEWSEITRKVPA